MTETESAAREHMLATEEQHDSFGPASDVVDVEQATAAESDHTFEHHVWLLRASEKPRQVAFDEIPPLLKDDQNLVWIDMSDYSEADMRALGKLLDLPEQAIRLTLGEWRRPRLDVFEDLFFTMVTVAELKPAECRVQANQLELFVGWNLLISAHKQPLPFSEIVLTRASSNRDLARYDSTLMLYIVLDELLAYYELLVEQVQNEIEVLEERALTDTSDDFLGDLLAFKRYLFALSRLADQHRNVFTAYLRAEFPFMNDDRIRSQYQSLLDRLDRLIANLESTKGSVNGAFDIYISHVSHRTNGVMKVLTIVSTVLLPASVIFGFFGTSFEGVPLYEPADFWLMTGLALLTSVGALWYFRHRKWL